MFGLVTAMALQYRNQHLFFAFLVSLSTHNEQKSRHIFVRVLKIHPTPQSLSASAIYPT
jgi:hypothetical protein